MAANKFVLKGSGVEVDYTIGANPSFLRWSIPPGPSRRKFKPNQILSEDTVSERWYLWRSSSASTRRRALWLLLPLINVERGQTRISPRSAFMKPSAGRIPFRIGLRHGAASK